MQSSGLGFSVYGLGCVWESGSGISSFEDLGFRMYCNLEPTSKEQVAPNHLLNATACLLHYKSAFALLVF